MSRLIQSKENYRWKRVTEYDKEDINNDKKLIKQNKETKTSIMMNHVIEKFRLVLCYYKVSSSSLPRQYTNE